MSEADSAHIRRMQFSMPKALRRGNVESTTIKKKPKEPHKQANSEKNFSTISANVGIFVFDELSCRVDFCFSLAAVTSVPLMKDFAYLLLVSKQD